MSAQVKDEYIRTLPVGAIEESKFVDVRDHIDKIVVTQYAERMKDGEEFPPIVVFNEPGTECFVVADGRHRLAAAKQAGWRTIAADVKNGDLVAALKFAIRCNTTHGKKRSPADLTKAFELFMSNRELSEKYEHERELLADLFRVNVYRIDALLSDWRQSAESKAKWKAKRAAEKESARDIEAQHKNQAAPARSTLDLDDGDHDYGAELETSTSTGSTLTPAGEKVCALLTTFAASTPDAVCEAGEHLRAAQPHVLTREKLLLWGITEGPDSSSRSRQIAARAARRA